MNHVYEEVDQIMTKLRVNMHKIKPCTRKYAFDLPPDIPKQADYLKLLYPYDSASAAAPLCNKQGTDISQDLLCR